MTSSTFKALCLSHTVGTKNTLDILKIYTHSLLKILPLPTCPLTPTTSRSCKRVASLCHRPGRGQSLANQRPSLQLLTNERSPIRPASPRPPEVSMSRASSVGEGERQQSGPHYEPHLDL